MPKDVYIGVVGVGGVGAALFEQLASLSTNQHLHPNFPRIHLLVIARSTQYLCAAGGATLAYAPDAIATYASLGSAPRVTPEEVQRAVLETLSKAPGRAVLVDNTAAADVAAGYPALLRAGVSVVTPNKKGFSAELALWDAIQDAIRAAPEEKPVHCYHEASVGAGLPVLSTLRDLLETGDAVQRIEGVFSGTLSYLFNGFAPVAPSTDAPPPPKWSAAVAKAKTLGYTEPDPREDLSGMDVARKVTILARLCGLRVEQGAFAVQSLIPAPLQAAASSDEFLQKLHSYDADMETLKADAEKQGKVLRYLGSVDVANNAVTVGLQAVPRDGPVAGLRGSDNIVNFYTQRYGDKPLVVQGAGAGNDVTAMGVLADLLRVAREL